MIATQTQNVGNELAFRQTLGAFATGVTVVTTVDPAGQAVGVTINSFNALSLHPPLILWSLGADRRVASVFLDCEAYVINILSSQQRQISRHFADSRQAFCFEQVPHDVDAQGRPLIAGACASLCVRQQTIERFGDHYLLVGEVVSCSTNSAAPLVFFSGGYHELAACV